MCPPSSVFWWTLSALEILGNPKSEDPGKTVHSTNNQQSLAASRWRNKTLAENALRGAGPASLRPGAQRRARAQRVADGIQPLAGRRWASSPAARPASCPPTRLRPSRPAVPPASRGRFLASCRLWPAIQAGPAPREPHPRGDGRRAKRRASCTGQPILAEPERRHASISRQPTQAIGWLVGQSATSIVGTAASFGPAR